MNKRQKIEGIASTYNCSLKEAKIRFDMIQMGRELGRAEGRAEAQRFLRLALGVEVPTQHEKAMWNNPVPLLSAHDDVGGYVG